MFETSRLVIFPLTEKELDDLLNDRENFKNGTGYIYEGEELEGILYDIFSKRIKTIKESNEEYYWYTMWVYAIKSTKTIVGSIACKNSPLGNKDIEIGYGINAKYGKQGYTTEAVKALTRWILQQSCVQSVIAEVEKENVASQRVLQKCGMKKYKTIHNSFWYKIER